MIKIEKTEVVGWEAAIRGMRNPMNSWEKSDSTFKETAFIDVLTSDDGDTTKFPVYFDALDIGPNDHELMMKLSRAGTDHRKFMRMITVYVDITAPLYWWKEFDTYKVGTVANSCSTMHKIHEKELTLDGFSHEHLMDFAEGYSEDDDLVVRVSVDSPKKVLLHTIETLNYYREMYLHTKVKPMKDESKRAGLMKKYWWQMIQLLPSSYNQKRTIMLNYEVLANIYKARRGHKLDCWREFCSWVETLPYSELITGRRNE